MNVGIGTYSFGGMASYLGLGPTLLEKFRMIRSLGYDMVELLPVDLDNDTEDIKRWLAETGLLACSVHAEPSEEIIRKMAAIGGKAVIWAGTPFNSKEEAREVAEFLDQMADFAEPYGIQICYHNHSQEFWMDGDKCLLEHLLDSGSKFYSQLDCGWAMKSGMYPPYFIRKYKNRIASVHVRENSKVFGLGKRPASRHEQHSGGSPFANAKQLPLVERQRILDEINARSQANGMRYDIECPVGAPDSNIDWKEVKRALGEQDFEAFWVVEREGFYDDHDSCLAADCAWLKQNL